MLLLDEPTAGLDPKIAAAVRGLRGTGSVEAMAKLGSVDYTRLIHDPAPMVRQAVVQNLLSESAEVYFGHDRAVSEQAIAVALAARSGSAADPALAAKLLSEVSTESVGSQVVAELLSLLDAPAEPSLAVLRASIVTALGGVPSSESARVATRLIDLYRQDASREVHRAVLQALVRLEMTRAVPLLDALRSVAAEMGMEELHEQRTLFVQKVQQAVSEDLLKNGLELEAVSLTGLDQTTKEYFNPDNAFDAEGLTKLTEAIELRRKKRNEISQDTEVEIQKKNLAAVQQKLEIAREEEYAKLEQQRVIEIRKAQQQAEISREQAEKRQAAEQAQIVAQQQVDQSKITADRAVAEQRIAMEQQLKAREVEKLKMVELAEQDRAIAIAEKSKAQSESAAAADAARAQAVKAAEQVDTVREVEKAERQKRIELVEAAKEAEREQIGITMRRSRK